MGSKCKIILRFEKEDKKTNASETEDWRRGEKVSEVKFMRKRRTSSVRLKGNTTKASECNNGSQLRRAKGDQLIQTGDCKTNQISPLLLYKNTV